MKLPDSLGLRSEPKASILLVDDNPANLLSLRSLLEDLGQHLVEVGSGEEAIRRVMTDDFAVVLLDVLMPGISGFETAQIIRGQERSQHTPIIFLTAHDVDRPEMEEGYALGAVDFLVKPLMPVALQSKVRSFVEVFLERQRAQHEAAQLRLLIQGTTEYAIFMLDPQGRVLTWNVGAERIKGYKADEIIGQHFSKFYPQEAINRGWPAHELKAAQAEGRFEDEGWRVRKDGSQFWANVVITALRDHTGKLLGFSKITRDMTERKKSEEDARRLVAETTARRVAEENSQLIKEQRERLHVTLASIGDAVISTDAEGRIDFLNPVAQELVGWGSEEAAHRKLQDVFNIVNEETRQPVENPALRALQEGVIVGLANRTVLISKDGTERPIDDSAAPIRDEKGGISGSVLVFRDISERKRSEAALKEQVRLLSLGAAVGVALVQADQLRPMLQRFTEALVANLHGAFARIWTLNPLGDVLELQASAGQYTHLDGPHSRVPVGKYKIGLIAQERQPHLTNTVVGDPRVSDQEWAQREGMVAFAGYPLIVEDRLLGVMAMFARHPLTESTLAAMASVANEIGLGIERKQAQERLREQQEWLRVTLASIGDAVVATDTRGRVTFLNGVAQELTGWAQTDAAGELLERVFHILHEETRQPVENPVEKVLRDGVVVGLGNHTVLLARDGTERPIDDSAAPIRNTTGEMIGVVLIFRDVTGQRLAERELRASEARKSAILETALDCIITMDHQGNVVEFNPAAEKTFGYSRDQVIGQTLADLIIPPSLRGRHRQGIAHYLATGVGPVLDKRLELPALRADGSEFPAELAITRISTPGPPLFTAYLRDITEQKRAEEEVLRAGKQAQTILESITDAFCALDRDLRFTYVNRHAEVLLGLAGGELLGKTQWEVYPHTQGTVLDLHYRRALAEGVPVHFENFDPMQNRWYEFHGYPSPEGLNVYFRDVSERKRAEIAIRESEQRFRQLANAMPQIVWTAQPDGNIDYLNRRWTDFTGLSDTVGSEGWGRILHSDDTSSVGERWATSVRSGVPFEMELRLLERCSQTYRWHLVRTVPVHGEAGQIIRWFGTATDIQEQKQAEESSRYLAEASAALAGVVDYESTLQKMAGLAVPHFADWSAVDVADKDGSLRRLVVAHRDPAKVALAHELMRAYPPDPEAPGGAIAVLRTGQPKIVSEITDEMLVEGAEDNRHLELIRSLGLKSYICVPLIVSGIPFGLLTFATAESGRRYTNVDLALATDLAHRASVAVENTQLYQSLRDADRRKDEFLATLAHELRNPLAPIRNSLQILKLPRVDAAVAHQTRDMMERQVHHLVRLVDDLLDVSRVMRGKIELRKERVELSTIIARAVETAKPLIELQSHKLDVSVAHESLLLDADPVRLAQVVGNLLTNSAKYSEPHGQIWLTAWREDDQAVLSVRDMGIGIAPDMLPHVFELFVQADHASTKAQGGLGIGLTLVKNLVEMHNGSVQAHSAGLGQGSEFTVRLPLVSVEPIEDATAPLEPEQAAPISGHRLLVVDDNHDAAISLSMLLRLQGHEVRVAHDGASALEIVARFRPDLIFLDIGMPGMDGYEVARRIRKMPGLDTTILVALTGWGQREDRRRTAEAGFNHHLVKPPEPLAVEAILASLPH